MNSNFEVFFPEFPKFALRPWKNLLFQDIFGTTTYVTPSFPMSNEKRLKNVFYLKIYVTTLCRYCSDIDFEDMEMLAHNENTPVL